MDHHPSCRPNDLDLMWVCSQCGNKEHATEVEEIIEAAQKLIMREDICDIREAIIIGERLRSLKRQEENK